MCSLKFGTLSNIKTVHNSGLRISIPERSVVLKDITILSESLKTHEDNPHLPLSLHSFSWLHKKEYRGAQKGCGLVWIAV